MGGREESAEVSELENEIRLYRGTAKLEKAKRERLAKLLSRLQTALSKQISLRHEELAAAFPGAISAVLDNGEKLRLVYADGRKESISVLQLEPEPYLSVVRGAALAVIRMIEEEDA